MKVKNNSYNNNNYSINSSYESETPIEISEEQKKRKIKCRERVNKNTEEGACGNGVHSDKILSA